MVEIVVVPLAGERGNTRWGLMALDPDGSGRIVVVLPTEIEADWFANWTSGNEAER